MADLVEPAPVIVLATYGTELSVPLVSAWL